MTEAQAERCRKRLEQFLTDLLEPVGRAERRHWGGVYVRGLLLDDGGSGKRGHFGREKGASAEVTRWPAAGAAEAGLEGLRFSVGLVFQRLRFIGAVGLAFHLQDDRPFD